MYKIVKIYLLLPLLVFLITSCGNKTRFHIDTSENRVEVKVKRFDLDLIHMDTVRVNKAVDTLFARYPHFFPFYLENTVGDSSNKDTIGKSLRDFVTSPLVGDINKRIETTFSDVSVIEKELSNAYTYINHYFPHIKLPEPIFFVSGLNIALLSDVDDLFIGIGTDFYLGADFELYQSAVYEYMLPKMDKERLPVDLVSHILFKNFRFEGKQNRLIDNMLYNGKVLYLLSVIMPVRTKHEIVGYTPEQWQWAETNEADVWKTIVGKKDLFSSDLQLIRKYLNDAPFTTPISQESPGKLGMWIGYRIVENYMERNKDVTLEQLMQMNDYQLVLEKSGYKP